MRIGSAGRTNSYAKGGLVAVLELKGVVKHFGAIEALSGVDFTLDEDGNPTGAKFN